MTGAGDILNADMATVGRWLRDGVAWWLAELAALVPPAWRRGGGGPPLRLGSDGSVVGSAPPAGSRPTVLVPAGLALLRPVLLPDLPADALWRTVEAEAPRLLPAGPGAMVLARRVVARDSSGITVELAALPLATGSAMADTLDRLGVRPARIGLVDGHDAMLPGFDFLPDLRRHGLVPPASRQPALWWTIVGFLVMLTVAVAVWRDAAANDALAALVAEQQPAVTQLQGLQRRISRLDAVAAGAARARDRQPLALIGRVAARLPEGSFLLRFEIDGDRLRLTGYKPPGGNLVQALRADPGLTEVRAVRSDSGADLADGLQPFDVSARVVR